jgi:hypothetical protein
MCALFSAHVRVVPANARNVLTNVRHVRTNVRHVRRNAYITCTVRVRYVTVRRKSFPNVRFGKALHMTDILLTLLCVLCCARSNNTLRNSYTARQWCCMQYQHYSTTNS